LTLDSQEVNTAGTKYKPDKGKLKILKQSSTSYIILLLTFFFVITGKTGHSQSNLLRNIAISEIRQKSIGELLKNVSQTGDFYFSYNNRAIPADSVISFPPYRGTVYVLLSRVLGDEYEFKEVPGYIILRHAPGRLDLTAEITKESGKPGMVKGYVKDAATGSKVGLASVYEKNLLISALTDKNGYFELNLKRTDGPVTLTASKDNYRDTTLNMLLPVVISSKPREKRYRYYPGESGSALSRSVFGRLFTSSRQRIQNLNMGNLFAYSPYQLSLTPGLSSHGMYNSQVINELSINILGGYTAGVDGVEMAGIFNMDQKDVSFLQIAGVFNLVGGNLKGVQATGVYNTVLNKVNGVQIAGGVNFARSLDRGMQIAGLMNVSDESSGFQLAGFVNRSKGNAGPQLAGVVNIAKKVKGLQFAGLLNIADSSDYPVAFINIIKNGTKSLTVSTDESLFVYTTFRSGGRVLYGLVGIGHATNGTAMKYGLEGGFGAHIIDKQYFSLNAELSQKLVTDLGRNSYSMHTLRALAAVRVSKRIRVIGGPDINLISADHKYESDLHGWMLTKKTGSSKLTALALGLNTGLQYIW
jgi:hypothetical protein